MIKIAPSILSADFAKLGKEIEMLNDGKADYIHIDVMDGHFVPNMTFGPMIVKAIRNYTDIPFDVHLMIDNPMEMVDLYIDAGADIITFHAETLKHLHRALQYVKSKGLKAGVSINPATSLCSLEYCYDLADMFLVMTVNPGYGGQQLIDSTIGKIKQLRKLVNEKNPKIEIEVDGGISLNNIDAISKAGANVFVAGSAIFNEKDPVKMITLLREKAKG